MKNKIVIEAMTVKDGKLYIQIDLDNIPDQLEIVSKEVLDEIKEEARQEGYSECYEKYIGKGI